MRSVSIAIVAFVVGTASVAAQVKPRPTPRPAPIRPAIILADRGRVIGRTYTNNTFHFEVTFPDAWLIPGDDFEAYMKKRGVDLSLKAPDSLPPAAKAAINQSIKRLQIVMTAYKALPGETDNAVLRIAFESLAGQPQIKDAVDYFDAIRSSYATLKLPATFKYSETQAEKLGKMQFAYLDASTGAEKKRTYATVRNGYAIVFAISYTDDADLQVLRKALEEGAFDLK